MPYRRLPNTDNARLKALTTAVRKANEADFTEQVISFKTLNEARSFLTIFESQVQQYHQTFETKVTSNKRYKHILSNARMYISHFIQVLNLAVIRGDIKKEQKELYHLDVNNHTLPDLSTEEALLIWGKNIIDGENERLRHGGFAIYNPTIAKVKVHYDIFKEYQMTQKLHKNTTTRTWEEVEGLRTKADTIILDIWNQVEDYYKLSKPYEKLCQCQAYGLIYYYRRGEEKLSPEKDIALQKIIDQSPTFQWNE